MNTYQLLIPPFVLWITMCFAVSMKIPMRYIIPLSMISATISLGILLFISQTLGAYHE